MGEELDTPWRDNTDLGVDQDPPIKKVGLVEVETLIYRTLDTSGLETLRLRSYERIFRRASDSFSFQL